MTGITITPDDIRTLVDVVGVWLILLAIVAAEW